MEQRLSLVTLGVRDLTKARAFYEALGWSGAVQPDADICFFNLEAWSSLSGRSLEVMELQGSSLRTTWRQRPKCRRPSMRGRGLVERFSVKQRSLCGEEHRERLQMLMVTSGGLRTTQGGACWKMGPFASR